MACSLHNGATEAWLSEVPNTNIPCPHPCSTADASQPQLLLAGKDRCVVRWQSALLKPVHV
eukprot:1153592-Pelagomonas_calceolata.AAC.5